jgi:hypothetical protein
VKLKKATTFQSCTKCTEAQSQMKRGLSAEERHTVKKYFSLLNDWLATLPLNNYFAGTILRTWWA